MLISRAGDSCRSRFLSSACSAFPTVRIMNKRSHRTPHWGRLDNPCTIIGQATTVAGITRRTVRTGCVRYNLAVQIGCMGRVSRAVPADLLEQP